MKKTMVKIQNLEIPAYSINTIIVGTGAASLSCADHLHNLGQTDIALITEKLGGGTSNNTGSDKQTYYKLSVFGKQQDSPYEMAKSLFDGGCMHGDLALIESILSTQCFFRLVNIGVPFPHNRLGGYVGYKTDHDPRQRATSAGPWTSSQMVKCLLKEVNRRKIKIFDEFEVIGLIKKNDSVCGLVALDKSQLNSPHAGLNLFQAENVVFGVGGPGGIYKTSVYPKVHTGAIGLALETGAKAVNLTESQYGLASIKFRWNVSGTYQQVIPRYISTDQHGEDEQEFLNPYFESMGQLCSDIFLKGYQWPFDPGKIANHGSSLIDLLVFMETVKKSRRVFMDFRQNPGAGDGLTEFRLEDLDRAAYDYLKNSQALLETPIKRLNKMNKMAIDLYKQNGIDLQKEPLEVAVCAQHNNGGLWGDIWWESNIKHLFPIGEVNGSHGVYRPGGSALNSGQVGSLRAAQRIVKKYNKNTTTIPEFIKLAGPKTKELNRIITRLKQNREKNSTDVARYRLQFQQRMTDAGSHIRESSMVKKALKEAYEQYRNYSHMQISSIKELPEAFKNRHLVLAHIAYLQAIDYYLDNDGGSRGSYMVLDKDGRRILEDKLGEWRYKPENLELKEKTLEISWNGEKQQFECNFTPRRPLPETDSWFENVWNDFIQGKVFD